MKSFRQELWFEVPRRRALLNITPQVEACLRESGIREGLCLVNAMHITASVFINDDESGLHADFERWLEKLAPEKPYLELISKPKTSSVAEFWRGARQSRGSNPQRGLPLDDNTAPRPINLPPEGFGRRKPSARRCVARG
jgi:hypothetical protein